MDYKIKHLLQNLVENAFSDPEINQKIHQTWGDSVRAHHASSVMGHSNVDANADPEVRAFQAGELRSTHSDAAFLHQRAANAHKDLAQLGIAPYHQGFSNAHRKMADWHFSQATTPLRLTTNARTATNRAHSFSQSNPFTTHSETIPNAPKPTSAELNKRFDQAHIGTHATDISFSNRLKAEQHQTTADTKGVPQSLKEAHQAFANAHNKMATYFDQRALSSLPEGAMSKAVQQSLEAHRIGEDAKALSDYAEKTQSTRSHRNAADLQELAADLHKQAGNEHSDNVHVREQKAYHDRQRNQHLAMAAHHKKEANLIWDPEENDRRFKELEID